MQTSPGSGDYGSVEFSRPFCVGDELMHVSVDAAPDKYNPPFGAVTRKTSIPVGALNIICTSLDGTAMTLPYVFAKCGIVGGPILIVSYALITATTLTITCSIARKLRAASYTEIVYRLFGQYYGHAFSAVLFLILFAILVGFLILARQISVQILDLMFGDLRIPSSIVLLVFVTLCAPLMLVDTLHKLRYTCYLGFASIILVLSCLAYTLHRPPAGLKINEVQAWEIRYFPTSLADVLETIPIATMLYLSHFNVLGVYTQLHNPTSRRIGQVICSSMLILTILFITFGIVGYLIFLELFDGRIADNILQVFPAQHSAMLLGRASLLLTLMCTLPVMMVPARAILIEFHDDCLALWAEKHRHKSPVNEFRLHDPGLLIEETEMTPLTRPGAVPLAPSVPSSSICGSLASEPYSADYLLRDARMNLNICIVPHTALPPSPGSMQTEASSVGSESDVGVGFDGVEAHWRHWQALPGGIVSIGSGNRTSFERLMDAAEDSQGSEPVSARSASHSVAGWNEGINLNHVGWSEAHGTSTPVDMRAEGEEMKDAGAGHGSIQWSDAGAGKQKLSTSKN